MLGLLLLVALRTFRAALQRPAPGNFVTLQNEKPKPPTNPNSCKWTAEDAPTRYLSEFRLEAIRD
jgi:hypothetical protein